MFEEISEYEKYLLNFGVVEKPELPEFDVSAYTNNEYLSEIFRLMGEFENIDDEYLTVKHLKGY